MSANAFLCYHFLPYSSTLKIVEYGQLNINKNNYS